jgi:DNA ligase-1
MQRFAELYRSLDQTTSRNAMIDAMAEYFGAVPPEDAAWGVFFLSGRRPKRLISSVKMREWAAEEAGIPSWLLEECYTIVGDTAETIALLLPGDTGQAEEPLHHWVEERLLPLRELDEGAQRAALVEIWQRLGIWERFVWNKLITSGLRVGVSEKLTVQALAQATGVDRDVLTHRLMGHWEPSADFYHRLTSHDTTDADKSRPYPFLLAHPVEESPEELGARTDFQAEWKWDGIRGQIVRRSGETFIWSRGGELITHRYPEVRIASTALPNGTVLDGELLAWKDGEVLPFGMLQRRLGRKTLPKTLKEKVPISFLAFDLLELEGTDLRERPLRTRRRHLESLFEGVEPGEHLRLSELLNAASWTALAERRSESRTRKTEGLMLKRKDKPYAVGRPKGNWFKWKVDPYTLDGVLLYARRGSGRRATLYSDYTFALWDDDELIPFAKAYSGLTDQELEAVDSFVRQHTIERFGPVRSVEPKLVFEIAFAGVRRSNRHKSGVAVRFPRMVRRRRNLKAENADSLEQLQSLLPPLPDHVDSV